jgi:glutaredoxin
MDWHRDLGGHYRISIPEVSMKANELAPVENAKQQCTLARLRFSLVALTILYAGGLAYYLSERNWPVFFSWLVLLPCARWLGLRLYPLTSKLSSHGSPKDKLPSGVSKTHVEVIVYSHNGCPFCPILRRRLEALQKQMDFTLTEVDLTLKPQIAASKEIRSVPVVEVGGSRLVGNATTEQLAEMIAGATAFRASVPA